MCRNHHHKGAANSPDGLFIVGLPCHGPVRHLVQAFSAVIQFNQDV